MKTIAKHYSSAGNVSLLQFETLEEEGFPFLPAVPFIEDGSIQIRELNQSGSVNTLLAINPTNRFFLLTDMDLLNGAKQNRTVNTSVLIAPESKQEIRVSCVERSRWSYKSPVFKPGKEILDPDLRSSKAGWLRKDSKSESSETQSKIWGMIDEEMMAANLYSGTEDYNEILEHRKEELLKRETVLPPVELKEGMNGLAVFQGNRLFFFDVFGNRESYNHYFKKLTSCIPGLAGEGNAIGEHEACFRLGEIWDDYLAGMDGEIDPGAGGAGDLRWSDKRDYRGFELSLGADMIHLACMSVK